MKNNLGNKETMAKNIQAYMDKNNKSRSELCEALGVPYTTLTDWLKAKTYPRIDKIEMMANYFGITKADLVEEEPVQDNINLDELEFALFGEVRDLTDSEKEELLRNARRMNEVRRLQKKKSDKE